MSNKSCCGNSTTESGPELRSMQIQQRESPVPCLERSNSKGPSSSSPSYPDSVTSDISDDDSRYGYFLSENEDTQDASKNCELDMPMHQEISDGSLPEAPLYVTPNSNCIALSFSLSTVVERINNFLRVKSISNSIHLSQQEVRMDCCTDTLLCFAIFLWRRHQEERLMQQWKEGASVLQPLLHQATDSSQRCDSDCSATKSQILVELQRRRGCSIVMSYVKRAFFLAIRSGVIPDDGPLRPRFLRQIPRRISERYSLDSSCKMKAAERKAAETKEVFSQSCNLLKSGYKDQNRLGLENLIFLTDPSSPVDFPRVKLARALVFNEGNVAPYIRQSLLTYMGSSCSDDPRYSYYLLMKIPGDGDEESCPVNAMDILALRLVANALDLVKNIKQSDTTVQSDLYSLFWSELIESFHLHMREASSRPQEAALSAKCLRLLTEIFPDGHVAIFGSSRNIIWKNLVKAHEYGELYHSVLEKESQKLIATLRDIGYS